MCTDSVPPPVACVVTSVDTRSPLKHLHAYKLYVGVALTAQQSTIVQFPDQVSRAQIKLELHAWCMVPYCIARAQICSGKLPLLCLMCTLACRHMQRVFDSL